MILEEWFERVVLLLIVGAIFYFIVWALVSPRTGAERERDDLELRCAVLEADLSGDRCVRGGVVVYP